MACVHVSVYMCSVALLEGGPEYHLTKGVCVCVAYNTLHPHQGGGVGLHPHPLTHEVHRRHTCQAPFNHMY